MCIKARALVPAAFVFFRAELKRILQQMNSSSRSRKLGCLDEKCMIASLYDSNG